jgi:hypothetical protein
MIFLPNIESQNPVKKFHIYPFFHLAIRFTSSPTSAEKDIPVFISNYRIFENMPTHKEELRKES